MSELKDLSGRTIKAASNLYSDEVEELIDLVKEGGLLLLDALYQLTLNPSPRSAGYALEANLERIRSNLVARYGRGEGVRSAIELLTSLIGRQQYEKLIDNIKELLSEDYLAVLKEDSKKRFDNLTYELKAGPSVLTILARKRAITVATSCAERPAIQDESFLGPFHALCDALGVSCSIYTAEMLAVKVGLASKLVRETGSCREVVLVFHDYAEEIVRSYLNTINLPSEESVAHYLGELYEKEGYRYILRLLASLAWSDKDYLKVDEEVWAAKLEKLKPLIGFSHGYVASPLMNAKTILRKAFSKVLSETFNAVKQVVEEEVPNYITPLAELKVLGVEQLLSEYEIRELAKEGVIRRRVVLLPSIVQKEKWREPNVIFISLLDTPPSAQSKLLEGQTAILLGGRAPTIVTVPLGREPDELASHLADAISKKLPAASRFSESR